MNYSDSEKQINEGEEHCSRPTVSPAVIRRLPRYFRYLRELIRQGRTRISSGEFSEMMHMTASQMRQDLNCFGGFGQQGYGYNVNYLYEKVCELLGVQNGLRAIIVGAGDLGRALVRSSMFEKRGVQILAMFDVNPDLIGREFGGVQIYHVDELESFCRELPVDLAVLTLPKEFAEESAKRLTGLGIAGLWNFTGKDIEHDPLRVAVENVHLGDSLMFLNYRVCQLKDAQKAQNEEA
ncbi:MAG: redox-sensing transcriptional repressor Rex [Ruminococcaceae bacterium]|nr:redox-sensing transcriptional repressor Rex [Oscillospiraceae bacterium]